MTHETRGYRAEVEAATDRRVTENHYPRMITPTTRYPVDDRGKAEARPGKSRSFREGDVRLTVSILFQAMRMEGTVPGSQFSTTGVRFDEAESRDIAGRPDGKAYKNVPNKPDRGAWARASDQGRQ